MALIDRLRIHEDTDDCTCAADALAEIERLQKQVEAARSVPHLRRDRHFSQAFRLGHATALGKVAVATTEARRVR